MRDLNSLLTYLEESRIIEKMTNNLITQWGPSGGTPMMSMDLLPPRRVPNEDTIEDVRYRTVAALDGTRYSPAQLADSGELFGSIWYRLGHSDIARQIVGRDYDGIVNYLNRNMSMAAAARFMGLFDAMIIQSMVVHDEIANWEAIVYNTLTRRGDNGYYEYVDGPDLSLARVNAGVDWTDDDVDPYASDIEPRIRYLTNLGYAREGIRIITAEAVLQTLADHPATARRIVVAPLATGQSVQEAVGFVSTNDVERLIRTKLGVRSVNTNDHRFMTRTGSLRAFPADGMVFIATTSREEVVIYDEDDPSDVRVVRGNIGFTGIGNPNGTTSPGRRSAMRAFTNQKDARIELEGWQATGPVILDPTAIAGLQNITTGTVVID